jgi:iron complex transport system ATP-binding protein
LANLARLESGAITVGGKRLDKMTRAETARLIGYVPQNLTSVYGYNVPDFIVMGRAPYISNFRQPTAGDFERVAQVMSQLGITHLADKPYTELSGGEQQQVCIARVLVQDPAVILLDEPTSALDFGNQLKVIRLVRELAAKGYAIIMTTHNPDHAIMLADAVGVMSRDGTLRVGSFRDVINEELLSDVYKTEVRIAYVEKIGRDACLAKL